MIERAPLRIRLTLDSGLSAYVRAWVKGVGLQDNERDTIIYFTRERIIKTMESEAFRRLMMPHLPDDIRRAWGDRP